jgi:hypothetical protein|nr:MAG TPA: hypothetical protein [Bacteriophage sp.]
MQKIRIDFDNPGLPQHISAVENDSQSRFFQATLYENGKPYTAPAGASYSIMYSGFGPQNQGWYDTINDGAGKRAACTAAGNTVTCEIARQALQVPGHVSIVLCVTTGKGYMLKSWPIECDCKNDHYDSTAEIESFFYITQVSNADWTQAIQAVEELKNTIDPTLSISGKAADAKKTGDAVGQLKEEIVNYVGVEALNINYGYSFSSDLDLGTKVTTFESASWSYAVINVKYLYKYSINFKTSLVANENYIYLCNEDDVVLQSYNAELSNSWNWLDVYVTNKDVTKIYIRSFKNNPTSIAVKYMCDTGSVKHKQSFEGKYNNLDIIYGKNCDGEVGEIISTFESNLWSYLSLDVKYLYNYFVNYKTTYNISVPYVYLCDYNNVVIKRYFAENPGAWNWTDIVIDNPSVTKIYIRSFKNNPTSIAVKYSFDSQSDLYYMGKNVSELNKIVSDINKNISDINKRVSKNKSDMNNKSCINPLFIKTPFGYNEPLHPSVLYFENAWNGYKYWMAESPLPDNTGIYKDRYECPCIHVSNDGVNWITPNGLVNPIDDLTESEISDRDCFSDPCLVYREDKNEIELWYRYTKQNSSEYSPLTQPSWLFRKTSSDGVNWSDREVMNIYADSLSNLYPDARSMSIHWDGTKYEMWYVNGEENGIPFTPLAVHYTISYDGKSWDNNSICIFIDSTAPWHIDVQKDEGIYHMIAYYRIEDRPIGDAVIHFTSNDGISWEYANIIAQSKAETSLRGKNFYKSCAVKVGNRWHVYVTIYSDEWCGIGLMIGKTLDSLVWVDGTHNKNNQVYTGGLTIAYSKKENIENEDGTFTFQINENGELMIGNYTIHFNENGAVTWS